MLKFYSVLRSFESKYQFAILNLVILMVFIACLELLSVGMIIPLISGIIKSSNEIKLPFINQIFENDISIIDILFLFGLIYIFKTFFLIIFQKLKFKKIFQIQSYLSNIVLNNYLYLPTKKLIGINTSEITRNILNEIHMFVKSYLLNILDFILEIFITLSLIIFLLFYDPKISLSVLFPISIAGLLIYQLSKKKITKIGEARQIFTKFTFQSITEIFTSIREIKIYQKEDFASKSFNKVNSNKLESEQKQSYYLILPRIILELIVVVCLLAVVAKNIDRVDTDQLITTLALFGVTAIKIFPSINKIVTTFQRLKFADPATRLISEEIKKFKEDKKIKINLQGHNVYENWKKIIIKDLNFSFGEKEIFKNLNLTINKSEKICLMGESGTGKTTLLNLLLMLYESKNKYLYIDSEEAETRTWNQMISYLPQDIFLFDASIKDNITFMETENEFSKDKFSYALKVSELNSLISKLPSKEDEIVAEFGMKFSGGQKQRIGIARSFYKSRDIMIFDESTSQLDQASEEKIVNNLISTNKTVIFVTHKKHLRKFFTKVLQIKDKNITEI